MFPHQEQLRYRRSAEGCAGRRCAEGDSSCMGSAKSIVAAALDVQLRSVFLLVLVGFVTPVVTPEFYGATTVAESRASRLPRGRADDRPHCGWDRLFAGCGRAGDDDRPGCLDGQPRRGVGDRAPSRTRLGWRGSAANRPLSMDSRAATFIPTLAAGITMTGVWLVLTNGPTSGIVLPIATGSRLSPGGRPCHPGPLSARTKRRGAGARMRPRPFTVE
jgi:hypothetical protein